MTRTGGGTRGGAQRLVPVEVPAPWAVGEGAQALCQEIVETALAATGSRLITLSILSDGGPTLQLLALAAAPGGLIQRGLAAARQAVPGFDPFHLQTRTTANPLIERVYVHGESVEAPLVALAEGTVDPLIARVAEATIGIRSTYVCPLWMMKRIAGSIAFYVGQPLSLDGRRVCDAFARQASLTLEHVQLVEVERRRAHQAEQLTDVLAAVGATASLGEALQALVTGAVSLLRAEYGSVQLFPRKDDAGVRMIVGRDGSIERREARPGRVGSFSAAIRQGGPPTVVEDYWALDPATYPVYDFLRRQGRRSAVYAPIDSGSRRIGCLHVDHSQPGFFDAAALSLATALAAQVGGVIERAGLADALQQTQADALRQERLRVMGQMASGVAHDLNNALAPVLGFAELLLARPHLLSEPEAARPYLEYIYAGAQGAAAVVSRLRDFYRSRAAGEPFAPVDVRRLLEETATLTAPRWRHQARVEHRAITLDTDVDPALASLTLVGDEAALREALTNLIFNAVDAMPHGGVITMRAFLDAGSAVIEVADTGTGMEEEVRQQAGKPFFTTKGESGAGLGLAMVHSTVQRHSGTWEIESTPGAGTTIRLRVPLHRAESSFNPPAARLASRPAPGKAPSTGAAVPPAPPERRALRVLVADDDAAVRETTRAYLAIDGHTVVVATGGREALERCRTGAFDLVIVDRSMPDLGGDEVAAALKERDPKVPVLLLTGFGNLMIAAGERPAGVDLVLGKPATLAALRAAVAHLTAPAVS